MVKYHKMYNVISIKGYSTAHRTSFLYSRHSLSRHRISRHSGYVNVFVKSRIMSLYILYTFILYKSTFVSWHFAYLDMFLGPKQCFHTLIYNYASCENRNPCVFPGQIWHQLFFPGAVSIGHSICKAYVIDLTPESDRSAQLHKKNQ